MLFDVELVAKEFCLFAGTPADAAAIAAELPPDFKSRNLADGLYRIGTVAPAAPGALVNLDLAASDAYPRMIGQHVAGAGEGTSQYEIAYRLTVEATDRFAAGVEIIQATMPQEHQPRLIEAYRSQMVWNKAHPLAHAVLTVIGERMKATGMNTVLTPVERQDRCRLTAYRDGEIEGALELGLDCGVGGKQVVTFPVMNILFSDGSRIGSLQPSQLSGRWETNELLTDGDLDVFRLDHLQRVFAATLVPFKIIENSPGEAPR